MPNFAVVEFRSISVPSSFHRINGEVKAKSSGEKRIGSGVKGKASFHRFPCQNGDSLLARKDRKRFGLIEMIGGSASSGRKAIPSWAVASHEARLYGAEVRVENR
jgi:hypothetical protein